MLLSFSCKLYFFSVRCLNFVNVGIFHKISRERCNFYASYCLVYCALHQPSHFLTIVGQISSGYHQWSRRWIRFLFLRMGYFELSQFSHDRGKSGFSFQRYAKKYSLCHHQELKHFHWCNRFNVLILAGTPDDKLRLFIIHFISCGSMSTVSHMIILKFHRKYFTSEIAPALCRAILLD